MCVRNQLQVVAKTTGTLPGNASQADRHDNGLSIGLQLKYKQKVY